MVGFFVLGRYVKPFKPDQTSVVSVGSCKCPHWAERGLFLLGAFSFFFFLLQCKDTFFFGFLSFGIV